MASSHPASQARPSPDIAIVTDDPGWHGKRLVEAFRARGFSARYVALGECHIDLQRGISGVVMPGFEQALPQAVFVRGVAGGSLQQVVLRMDFLHYLGELGIPVYNHARAIEKSVDKAMTSVLLHHAGIPTPPTWVTEQEAEARAVLMREFAAGHDVLVKPLFGSQGEGIVRLKAGDALPAAETLGNVWYMQRYSARSRDSVGEWSDWRVMVIAGRPVAAMLRRGKSWLNNVAQGGVCEAIPVSPDDALMQLAVDATRACGMDYAGIDILRDDHGQLTVLEVNSIPAWKGLQGVTSLNIAQALADDLITRIPRAGEIAC
ncbi:ATP-grasp domain-containing protein [Methyloversatilis universalis]|uniref:ATP-grasp domain-containing protein n=1 Tax=Methyloversatilis universalis TaxID=378211 RepID=UPI00036BFAEF|nr:RimK family alpha-L-glutamate ligase [Methyloversatilis universalis]